MIMYDSVSRSGNVLVVDDDPIVTKALSTQLRKIGYSVDTAISGSDAVNLINQNPYDVVLSDICMPDGDGLSLLGILKKYNVNIPLILMTGQPTMESAIQAVRDGAYNYLLKPCHFENLSKVVSEALDKNKSQDREMISESFIGKVPRYREEQLFDNAIDSMWLAFQPIVSVKNHSVVGYEALLRSEEEKLANPLDFIAAANRVGRIRELGQAIRDKVANHMHQLPDEACIFVNVHSQDLTSDDLYDARSRIAKCSHRIIYEITERESIDQIDDLCLRIIKLKELGYKLAVDDLGAGTAGLTCFTQIEPDYAKIDLSLVRGVDKHPIKQRIIDSIVRLCHQLDVEIIAEGVESEQESMTLRKMGLDIQQGYWFAKPNPQFTVPRWSK